MGVNTPTNAIKVPSNPNASGPYSLVISGENAMPMAWAAAVPVATVATLRRKGFLLSFRIWDFKAGCKV